jgi:signal transduction histidine kinase
MLLGLVMFAIGLIGRSAAGALMMAAFSSFGLALAVGVALATAQYRGLQQLDEARQELLALHAELDLVSDDQETRLHDARAVIAAMSAALHALGRSSADRELTTAMTDQLETLRGVLARQSTDLEMVPIDSLQVTIRSFAALHDIDVHFEAPSGMAVVANRIQLIEIIQNLIDNSRKYAPGSPVEVACEPAGPYLRIAVTDRGPGIEGDSEALFLPGVRGPNPTQGFGEGLATARRSAEGMRGALWYEQRPGGGSRFVLRLPAATEGHADMPPPP